MRRLAPPALALALGAATAFWLVSCGGQDAQLLPGNTAREITENLDRVRQYAGEGECVGAADAAQEVGAQVKSLEGVDATLKRALEQGTTRLDEAIATCEETTTEPVRPSEETTTGDRTTESSEKEEKKREKELEKLEKEEEKAEKEEEKDEEHEVEPPEESPEEPPATVPPSEGGGTGAPGGVSPGSAVGGE